VPLKRRSSPPADPQQPPSEPRLADERPAGEAADDGLDWFREHIEAGVGPEQPLPPLAGAPRPDPPDRPRAGGPPAQPGLDEPGFDQSLGAEAEFDQSAGGEPEFDQTGGHAAAGPPAGPEPGGESPAVRRLRQSVAESDAPATPGGPEAAARPGAARQPGRATPIRPAPPPPSLTPARPPRPPGPPPPEARGEEPAPPAAAEPADRARLPVRPQPAPAAEPAPPAGPEAPLPGWDDLSTEKLVRRRPGGPTSGWQGWVYRITDGRVRPRPGRAERARRELEARVAAPITGCRRVAVFTLKGGVGKTTTTVGLGATFASHRADRVVAVDGSPDAGTLGSRVLGGGDRSPRDLIGGASSLARYADVRARITQTPSGLEVVASTMDPSLSEGFNDNDYRKIAAILERFYSLILTDCGPGALHSVIWPVLRQADQLLIVCAPSVDGARSASLTLDWLEQHNFDRLARSAVVVLNPVRPKAAVDLAQLEEHFARRCRAVVRVPFDRHLESGAEIHLGELALPTRDAYLRLAAAVADGVGGPAGPDAAEARPQPDRMA
jgi:MinD-like ATPase involved in chromosome partitioning or flagellar assembly